MTERIVDAHVHWRDPVTNPYEQLSDGVDEDGERSESDAQTYLPADYLADMAGIEVVGCIHIEAEWLKTETVGETRWLEGLVNNGELGNRSLGIVGFTDLSLPDADVTLRAHAAHPHVRGIRHILNYLPGTPALCWADRDYLADPAWHVGFAKLADHGLDFDLMCFAHQLPAVAELAARNPQTRIHLEHAALPHDHSSVGRQAWRDGMRALALQPNTDVKISGLGNTVPNWDVGKIRGYVLATIDIFGIERVCFASNSPTDKQFSSIQEIWEAFFETTKHFTTSERERLFILNALEAYRI